MSGKARNEHIRFATGPGARGDGYGAIPGKMGEAIAELFQGEHAPNPHDVAEAIARLVEQHSGARPARTVVGQSYGADTINAQAAPIQAQLLEAFGLSQLAELRRVPAEV